MDKNKILFINSCIKDNSRTLAIAEEVLKKYDGEIIRRNIAEDGNEPLDRELFYKREALLKEKKLEHELFRAAREFASADRIVIAAPFWDLAFPAMLKIYLETIMIAGITFSYEEGRPKGLCRAKSLEYVTTSGGMIFEDFGYSYIKSLALNFFGIPDVKCTYAENMDVYNIDASEVLAKAEIKEKR